MSITECQSCLRSPVHRCSRDRLVAGWKHDRGMLSAGGRTSFAIFPFFDQLSKSKGFRVYENEWLSCQPVAHRGLYDEEAGRPENSLAAFTYAASMGVAFELDIQLTKDCYPIIMHDRTLSRIVGDDYGPVASLDWAQISRLRMKNGGHRIPTLASVLELVGGRVPMILDVRRWNLELHSRLEVVVAQHVRGYKGQLALQSFDPLTVLRLRRLLPDRPVGQISGALRSAGPFLGALGKTMATNFLTRPDFISYEFSELPSKYASYWRGRPGPMLTFTVHDYHEEKRALELADNFFFSGYLPRYYNKR